MRGNGEENKKGSLTKDKKRVFVIGDTGIYPLFGFFSYAAFLLSYVDGKRNEYTWFYCCFLWYGFVDCYLFFIMVLEEKKEKGQYHLSAGDETDGFLLDYDSCLFFADKRCLSNDFAVN